MHVWRMTIRMMGLRELCLENVCNAFYLESTFMYFTVRLGVPLCTIQVTATMNSNFALNHIFRNFYKNNRKIFINVSYILFYYMLQKISRITHMHYKLMKYELLILFIFPALIKQYNWCYSIFLVKVTIKYFKIINETL